jgi:pyruvate/2-oxoglutarate dehydrogenase complex dihydrolipoamide acyltransferase (E2) component
LPHDVIMPALGMNQNTGKILSWLKTKGDTVNVGDALMEVETDKAVVEVEAQANGILTEVRHVAGSEVPVGHVIAVIGGGAAEPAPVNDATPAGNPARAVQAKAAETERLLLTQQMAAPVEPSPRERLTAPQATNRLLISPKARKEAARRGIELGQLSKLAKSAPYHVADLDLFQREIASPAPAGVANMMEFGATIDVEPTLSFTDWIGKEIGKAIALDVVWAAFARGSLGGGTRRIRIRSLRGSQDYVVAPYQGLSQIVPALDASDVIDLVIHDLTGSRLSRARVGSDRAPALMLVAHPSTSKLALTLHADEAQLSPSAAMQFLDSFARRVESPIRAIL